ncbi:MAG: formate dehydrogenase accessory sulfurtransferase FdhD, partial [Verrucomicrobia bacterium]|nr:formate dehydrogenase accessory sulfurtransferase FdhD [Verrucomicrobiota bacterium]
MHYIKSLSVRPVAVFRYQSDSLPVGDMDGLAVEEPLEIRVSFRRDGILVSRPVSITMRTPGLDNELAVGFLFTEGIICSMNSVEALFSERESSVNVRLSHQVDLERLNRHFYASSSCGICGKTSLEAIGLNRSIQLLNGQPRYSPKFLVRLPAAVREHQKVFDKTGGLHAAAFFDSRENLIRLSEDVGRHNAVDKVVGA